MSKKESKTYSATLLSDHRSRKSFRKLVEMYSETLPGPSLGYGNLVFLYDEQLAVRGRELLFEQLNQRAGQYGQQLVVTDVGFGRAGFYVNFDEIGFSVGDPDYEALIENWNTRT